MTSLRQKQRKKAQIDFHTICCITPILGIGRRLTRMRVAYSMLNGTPGLAFVFLEPLIDLLHQVEVQQDHGSKSRWYPLFKAFQQ